MSGRALVIDANILVRAVLGRRVREIIETYAEQATFFVPDVAYAEAEEHVPALVIRRGGDPEKAVRFLRSLRGLVDLIGSEVYADFESMARERLGDRDPEELAYPGVGVGSRLSHLDGRCRFFRLRCAHLDHRPSGGVFAAGASEIARNAEASHLVGAKLVTLAASRYFDKPRGNLRNQALSDGSGGRATCRVAVQKQDDLPEAFAQELLLAQG